MSIVRIGLDLAKQVFHVHGVNEREQPEVRKKLNRGQVLDCFARLEPCLVGMEACGSAHYWARELQKFGHEVRLMAPQFVAPYRKDQKNDGNDAEAICEAVGRPNMRFVPVKSAEQQAVLTLHRVRAQLIEERTSVGNQIRGLLSEYGIALPKSIPKLRREVPVVLEDAENGLPDLARDTIADLAERLGELEERIKGYDKRIERLADESGTASRLMQVEGIGPVTATALVATVGDARAFKNGRQFAAWLGLVPRQFSTGGKPRHGRITKRGDRYLRTLLVHGARAALCQLSRLNTAKAQWAQGVRQRRGFNKATIALAAKQARILWALMAREADYEPGKG